MGLVTERMAHSVLDVRLQGSHPGPSISARKAGMLVSQIAFIIHTIIKH